MERKLLVAGLALVVGGSLSAQGADPRATNANPNQDLSTAAPRTAPVANTAPGAAPRERVRVNRFPDAGARILVYDNDATHDLALTAATNIAGAGAVLSTQTTFNTQLAAGPWDAVAVDCPNFIPSGGWDPLTAFVNGGGKVVMSFWDWDNNSLQGSLALNAAMDVSVASSIVLTPGVTTIFDSGTTPLFAGVPMPNSDWHNHFLDDGDNFNALSGAVGAAHFGTASTPCLVLGNGGTTIAGPCFDEAGDTWLAGGGVRLWENMLNAVLGGPPPTRNILVFDENSINGFAQQAAIGIEPGTVVAGAADFNKQLTSQSWDAVAVDCPSNTPIGGWTDLINYISGGGSAVVSFWDWDAEPALTRAFGSVVSSSIGLSTQAFNNTGRAPAGFYAGVTLPNSDWANNWLDDGDEFATTDRTARWGHIGTPGHPTLVSGNQNRTIATMVFDEAGFTWQSNGSAVALWTNMINSVLSADSTTAAATERVGDPANPLAFRGDKPIAGAIWDPKIDHSTFATDAILDFVLVAPHAASVNVPFAGLGTLLVAPADALVVHGAPANPFAIAIPGTREVLGLRLTTQAGSITASGVRLANAIDLTIGAR